MINDKLCDTEVFEAVLVDRNERIRELEDLRKSLIEDPFTPKPVQYYSDFFKKMSELDDSNKALRSAI